METLNAILTALFFALLAGATLLTILIFIASDEN